MGIVLNVLGLTVLLIPCQPLGVVPLALPRHLLSNSFMPSPLIWYLHLVPEIREGIYCDNNFIINMAVRAIEESWEPKAARPWERYTQELRGGWVLQMHQGALTPCAVPQPLLELLAQSWLVCTAPGSAVEPHKTWACLFLAQGLGREKVSADILLAHLRWIA